MTDFFNNRHFTLNEVVREKLVINNYSSGKFLKKTQMK